MYVGKLVFSQVMDFMPLHTFRRCVARYRGNYKVKTFTCLDQFLCLAFAQITYRESLRANNRCQVYTLTRCQGMWVSGLQLCCFCMMGMSYVKSKDDI
jgi:hypothetical protein